MPTTVLGLVNDLDAADALPAADCNAWSDELELDQVQTCELMGTGCLAAADYNLSIGAGLSVDVSAGEAVVGAAGARCFVQKTGSTNVPSLTGSTTCYIYLHKDGTFSFNTTGTPPANSILVGTAATGVATVSSVNSAPTGRVNLGQALTGLRDWSTGNPVAYCTITVGAEAANVIQVSIQLQDAAGANVARRGAVLIYLSDSANAAPSATAPDGGWAAGTGYKVVDHTANLVGEFATDANGVARVDITHSAARTWYLHAVVANRVTVSSAITFA